MSFFLKTMLIFHVQNQIAVFVDKNMYFNNCSFRFGSHPANFRDYMQ